MGRGFKSAPGTFVENAMFKLPADIMMKTLGKIDESIDENLDTAQLYGDKLDEIKAMQIDNPAVNEAINSLNTEMDDLTQSVLDDPAGHRKLTGKFRSLSRKIDKSLNRGMLGAAQGNMTKSEELDKELDSKANILGLEQIDLIKKSRSQGYSNQGGLNFQEDGTYNDIANFQGAGVQKVDDKTIISDVITGFEKTSTTDTRVKGSNLVTDSDSYFDQDKLSEAASSATAEGTGWYDYNVNMINLEANVNGEELTEEEVEEEINARRARVTQDILTKKSGTTTKDSKTPITTGSKAPTVPANQRPGSEVKAVVFLDKSKNVGADIARDLGEGADSVKIQNQFESTDKKVQESLNNNPIAIMKGDVETPINSPYALAQEVMNGNVSVADAKKASGLFSMDGFENYINQKYNHSQVMYSSVGNNKTQQNNIIASVQSTPTSDADQFIKTITLEGQDNMQDKEGTSSDYQTWNDKSLNSILNDKNLLVAKGNNTLELFTYNEKGEILTEYGTRVLKSGTEGQPDAVYYKKKEEDQAILSSAISIESLKKKSMDPNKIENIFENADVKNVKQVTKKVLKGGKITEEVSYIYSINTYETVTDDNGIVKSFKPKTLEIELDPRKYGQ